MSVDQLISAWARVCNDGRLHWPGPDGLSNPGDDVSAFKPNDLEAWSTVEKALVDIRAAGISPELMRLVLLHIYSRGESLTTFRVPLNVLQGQLKQLYAEVRVINRVNTQKRVIDES